MLAPNITQNLVLLIFTGLLLEILTPTTMVFVAFGIVLTFLNIRISKVFRNVLALGVFVSYWLTYGKIIDPEIGINFLTSIIVLKIMERETERDQYMIFFGLLLLISAGSLFERTITYVIFFGVSFILLIRNFYAELNHQGRIKDFGIGAMWILPLTFLLFFMVPRMLNPIPFQQGGRNEGEVGYTPDVNISQLDSLSSNTSPVFHALVSRPLTQEELYWRGNTLSYTDGWNWNMMTQDRGRSLRLKKISPEKNEVTQKIRLFTRPDYFFSLDVPKGLLYGEEKIELLDSFNMPQGRWQWIQRYEAVSHLGPIHPNAEDTKKYLALPLPKKTKAWIEANFKGTTLKEIEQELRDYFYKEKFSYSLSPGRSLSFEEFMQAKKIGLCSHYASALAIILRAKNIPSRLVSGFMGGNYNRFADFYLVSQNDAHVWVEALSEGNWHRIDPTEWIAPERVRLGGEAFMASVQDGTYKKERFFEMPGLLQDMKQWFSQWDFMFYVWLEEMDYHTQEAWLTRFELKREWLFSAVPVILVIFMLGYMAFLHLRKKGEKLSPYQETWLLFMKKLRDAGILLSPYSIENTRKEIEVLDHPRKAEILLLWEELVEASFGTKEIELVREKIKRF